MDLQRIETTNAKTSVAAGSPPPEQSPVRRPFSPGKPGTSRAEDSLQWITVRLQPDLVREIEGHAKRTGTTRSDAIRDCLAVGMETIRGREGVPVGRVEELLGAIEGVRLALDLLGPPTLGTQRLLAHWAARDGAVKVSEDELLAEVRAVGADEWEQALAESERELPETPDARPPARS